MRTNLKRSLFLFLFMTGMLLYAQKTVTGIVMDPDGYGLEGVSVVSSGGNSTTTNVDGAYSIEVEEGDVLTFSGLDYASQTVTVGADDYYEVFFGDGLEIDEVVITAFGVEKEQKALGYAVTSLDSEAIESRPENDVGRVLRGKAPGVRVTGTGGVSGSGTNIIIRGYTSITGGNQPLFVVDGIPINSGTTNVNNSSSSGDFQDANTTSRFSDIDPNDIENISVLKGLSATTLYGTQGKNGVILITTKSGRKAKKGFEVSLSQSYFFNKIILPDYQNDWGAGFDNSYGPFFSNWGQNFNLLDEIENPYFQYSSLFPDDAFVNTPRIPYVPYNSQQDFFKTGTNVVTSVGISGSSERGSYTFNYGRTEDNGFLPENKFERNNFSLGGNYKLENGITIGGKLNYVRSNFGSPLTDASTGSDVTISTAGTGGIASIWNALYIPRSVNINWPYENPVTGESIFYINRMHPVWATHNSRQENNTDRIFGNFNISYDFNDWLSVMYRVGLDTYTSNQARWINKGGNDGIHPNGYLQTGFEKSSTWDHNIAFQFEKEFGQIGVTARAGANSRGITFNSDGSESRDQVVFGLQNHANYINHSPIAEGTLFADNSTAYQYFSEQNIMGVYFETSFDYKEFIFLNISGRNDWTSTQEVDYNSKFYPGVSLAFLPLDAFNIKTKYVDFLKLRAGYGTSAGFGGVYGTRQTARLIASAFQNQTGNNISTIEVASLLANPDLKPELTKEIEFGIEAQFFNNRLGFDFSYYDRETEDLILLRDIPSESGFTSTFDNIGNISNKGIELGFNITPLKTNDFRWDIEGNYTINNSEVSGLAEGEQIYLSGLFSTPANYAINGQQYGVLFGTRFLRDENGNRLVNENGYWIQDPENGIIGDPNPDWFMGLTSIFSYKGISMRILMEYQHGGDVYSTSTGTLLARGLVEDTNFDRTQGIILEGIRQSTGQPNDIQISASEAYFRNIGFGVDETSVYDATHLRLREASISYEIPKEWLKGTFIGSMSLSLVGQNLWVKAFNFPESINFDPEVNSLGVGNSQGLDYLTSWNSRRYGVNIKLTF